MQHPSHNIHHFITHIIKLHIPITLSDVSAKLEKLTVDDTPPNGNADSTGAPTGAPGEGPGGAPGEDPAEGAALDSTAVAPPEAAVVDPLAEESEEEDAKPKKKKAAKKQPVLEDGVYYSGCPVLYILDTLYMIIIIIIMYNVCNIYRVSSALYITHVIHDNHYHYHV